MLHGNCELVTAVVTRRATLHELNGTMPIVYPASICVPNKLSRTPHPQVARLIELHQRRPTPGPEWQDPRLDVYETSVTKAQLFRTYCLLDSIWKAAEQRGWSVVAIQCDREYKAPRTAIVIDGIVCHLRVVEIVNRTKRETSRFGNAFKFEPTGMLRLEHDDYFAQRRVWSDGTKHTVDDKLGAMFSELEAHALRSRSREDRMVEESKRRAILYRLSELDMHKQKIVLHSLNRWSEAEQLRAFVVAARTSGVDENWCLLAEQLVADIDPFLTTLSSPPPTAEQWLATPGWNRSR
jgi:hypothetical protein